MNGITFEDVALRGTGKLAMKVAPPLWRRGKAFLMGKRLLLLGPGASGKSSFRDYLLDGVLRDAQEEHKWTQRPEKHGQTLFDIGGEKKLSLEVKHFHEIPGQGKSAEAHATAVEDYAPHGAVLVFDGSRPLTQINSWANQFFLALAKIDKERSLGQRGLRSLVVCLNKLDKINEAEFRRKKSVLQSTMMAHLKPRYGKSIKELVPVFQTILVENPDDSLFVDHVIRYMAKNFGGRDVPFRK